MWYHAVLSRFSRVCVTPWTVAHQAPLSMGFSRQEYWSGLPCPPSEDLPDPGIEPASLQSPALAGRFFTICATWEAPSQVLIVANRAIAALNISIFIKHSMLCYAKSLQSCPTLCNPIDSSPPGSPVPGILQARTLEWVAISFSNA